ncbi:MAG: hypothetical protein RLZZ494_1446 [Pseudomonadota bacterium]|jgi:hypothetical protein
MSTLPPVVIVPLAQLSLLTGALQHLARQLDAGCTQAAQRAELLLERIEQDQVLPGELIQACQALREAIPALRPLER